MVERITSISESLIGHVITEQDATNLRSSLEHTLVRDLGSVTAQLSALRHSLVS
jgi:hypothetical protein